MTVREARVTAGMEDTKSRTPFASLLLASVTMVPVMLGAGSALLAPDSGTGERLGREKITWAARSCASSRGSDRALRFVSRAARRSAMSARCSQCSALVPADC